MKFTIAIADVCLPDYWPGHAGPHFAVNAYPRTLADLRAELRDDVRRGNINGNSHAARLLASDYVAERYITQVERATKAVYAAINRVRGARKGQRKVFCDLADRQDPNGLHDPMAYFVIEADDDEARAFLKGE